MPDQPTPQQFEDYHLLQGVARGEAASFAALYDRLAGPLYALCLRMTGEAHEAEDVLQEACLLIWRRAASYDPSKATVFGWAIHLTRCKAIDHLRTRGRRLRVLIPPQAEDAATGSRTVPVRETAVDERTAAYEADMNEQAGRVRRVLGELPADQFQAIELAFFSDLSHHEISARLGQPLGTIKARIRRGLLRLRDTLTRVP